MTDLDRNQSQRVEVFPPEEFGSDEEAIEFGRQLAMDSLLVEFGLREQRQNGDRTRARFGSWRIAAAAAAIAIAFGGIIVKFASNSSIELADGWRIEAVGDASFQILASHLVRLEHGELLIFSQPDGRASSAAIEAITVETPNARATAAGTRFYIDAHSKEQTDTTNPMKTKQQLITRVLVLAGSVSLANSGGSATAAEEELLIAEGDAKPIKVVVRANSSFAVDLYRQLVVDRQDVGNLIISPYSISTALAMIAEGARDETAREIGKVLHYPKAAGRINGDVADAGDELPWEAAKIRSGLAALDELLDPGVTPEQEKIAARIKELRVKQVGLAAKIRLRQLAGQDLMEDVEAEERLVEELNELLPKVGSNELEIANSLWGERSFPFDSEYGRKVEATFRSGGAYPVDFSGDPDGSRKAINAWIEEQTKGKFKEALEEGTVSPLTRLVVANTIYFRGKWAQPFRKQVTRDKDFFISAEQSIKVQTMKARSDEYRYGAFEKDGNWFDTPVEYESGTKPNGYPGPGGFAMAELPYRGHQLSMVILAPVDKDGLRAIESGLDSAKLEKWIGQLRKRSTTVSLPKFEAGTDLQLADALTELGMGSAFVQGMADFSGMVEGPSTGKRALHLDAMIHKAVISVDEEGTEAVAVSLAMPKAGKENQRKMVPFTPAFRADRPFLYLIRDKRSGSILFLGRVANPKH